MTTERAISEIQLIQDLSLEGVQSLYYAETKNEAIWSVLDLADGSKLSILEKVGLTINDINN